ncbi:MAG: DEAD/DEAH box helicase, partial [Treponema sp.]|nr:DEAD/DEAH box helicase [Treponema sp.]
MNESNVFNLLDKSLTDKLETLNIKEPTKVQAQIIPAILENKNLVFQSETGTGKTLAYLLPLIDKIIKTENRNTATAKIIIVAPTFELASQINQTSKSISNIKSALFIGGSPLKRQIESLKEKPEIIIGTPARLLELINLKKLKTQNISAIVFDEADRLVKKELYDESKGLLNSLPKETQIIACTATIDKNTTKFFSEAEKIVLPAEDILTKNITHWAIYAETRDKIDTLRKFIIAENPQKAIIFTSRADQVENIYTKLSYKKIECSALHAKTDKQLRKATIDRFKSGKIKILITSDLSARGLDIPGITHII